jgi:hypothetical protein
MIYISTELLKLIQELNVKTIGIIGRSVEDVKNFIRYNNLPHHHDYHSIVNDIDLRGNRFDLIMETDLAHENREYNRIMDVKDYCLKKMT